MENIKNTENKNEMQNKKSANRSSYIILAIVALLFVFSAVQAVQINTFQEKITNGAIVSTSSNANPSSSSSNSPSAKSSTPSMVGGC